MAFTRRHLPHWIPEETPIFVTWRLAGSLPLVCDDSPRNELLTDDARRSSVLPAFLSRDERLDCSPTGPVWLQDSRIACVVADALRHGETVRRFYALHGWVVMPNHVHAILEPRTAMPAIMRWLKGRTSRVANHILGRTGTAFWQNESFDHWVRSGAELQGLIAYVESNPVKAGLVETKEQWRWSSACRPDSAFSTVIL
jgi:REP element-mobilizing transposase RayT